jgi:hypothetical protein
VAPTVLMGWAPTRPKTTQGGANKQYAWSYCRQQPPTPRTCRRELHTLTNESSADHTTVHNARPENCSPCSTLSEQAATLTTAFAVVSRQPTNQGPLVLTGIPRSLTLWHSSFHSRTVESCTPARHPPPCINTPNPAPCINTQLRAPRKTPRILPTYLGIPRLETAILVQPDTQMPTSCTCKIDSTSPTRQAKI